MSQPIVVLTEQAAFVDEARQALGEQAELSVCSSLDTLRRQVERTQPVAAVVHLSTSVLGDRLPRAFFSDLQSAVGARPLYAVVDPGLDPDAAELAAEVLGETLASPLPAESLHRRLQEETHPLDDLAGLCTDLPHRELHGRTKSLITFSPEMFEMIDDLKVPAAHDVAVLLIGETGAGKTYLAQLIHEMSKRREEKLLTVACGALPPDLLESELFGHVRGAFTSADRDREGKFAAAGDGTLLLDEIDVLPMEHQAKLLRVIETSEYEPVGSNQTMQNRARLIVASNYDLEMLVHKGVFRMDLYYRLNTLCFKLPPLRARPWDVEYLARKFALEQSRQHGVELRRIEPECIDVLRKYPWPGNIRELENVMRRAVLYCQHGILTSRDLPSSVREGRPAEAQPDLGAATSAVAPSTPSLAMSEGVSRTRSLTLEARVEETEKRIIEESLRRHNHHRTATAKELGISRVTLYNKMKKFGMLRVTA